MPFQVERFFKRFLSAALRIAFGSSGTRAFEPGPSPRLLVIRQHNQLGDMLCVVPLLRALRRRFPASHITLMASPVNYEPMKWSRYVDEVINFDKREFLARAGGSLLRFPGYARRLRRRGFDVAVVPSTVSTSFTSDLLAFLSGAPVRIGAGSIQGVPNHARFLFTHPRNLDWRGKKDYHQVNRNMDIWPGDLGGGEDRDLSLEITLREDELERGKSFLSKLAHGAPRVIVYHPGAGKVPNRWPAERFARLADELSAHGFTVITSGPMDFEPVLQMVKGLHNPYELIENQPIRDVASALRYADLVVSNDTGIMHLAAAAGTPVLSLFGPTDPGEWAPRGASHRYIRGEGNDIVNITFDEVLETAQEMLRREHDR